MAKVNGMLLLKRILSAIGLIGIIGALLFLIAGRIDWIGAWVFLLLFGLFLLIVAIWGTLKMPELMEERSKVKSNVKTWDRVIMTLYSVLFFGTFVVAAFDAGRFRWSAVPSVVQLVGIIGMLPVGALAWWVMTTNAYASRFVRIQDDRGHQVVTIGPYRYVRHPLYVGVPLLFWCIPLVLESYWALIPGFLITILFVIRAALEDRTLQNELPGYADYANRVRYRLVPGVW
ncbi:MAG: isoprenylcysteine carboxylmethyltransferase family protein [Chloroflexi bacterium]|nr:isoprenylcysteine carboxylmethyltransferase family protein [Chloroflexota bacterium]